MHKFEDVRELGLDKIEALVDALNLDKVTNAKLRKLLKLQDAKEEKKKTWLWIFAIVGFVITVGVLAYAAYRYFSPDYLEDFEDEFEDDFEDEFEDEFEDDDFEDEEN